MKLVLLNLVALLSVMAVAMFVGHGLTIERWGAQGYDSMFAAAVICMVAAVVCSGLLLIAALRWPSHVREAAFAGIVLHLMLTVAMVAGYQVLNSEVHLESFLAWMLILYFPLFVVEVGTVLLVARTHWRPPSADGR